MIGELLNHLWQSTAFAAGAVLLTVVLRRNRAQVRYAVWLSASLKFLVPFSLLMSLGSQIGPLAPGNAGQIAPPSLSYAMEQITQPFLDVFPSSVPTASMRTVDSVSVIVLGVWACGFATIVLFRLQSWRRIRAVIRLSTPWQSSTVGVWTDVKVLSCPGVLEPGVIGWMRPILLLPVGIADRLTQQQLRAVLAHEMCHVRRRDNLTAALHMVVEAIFWFHPLVWWVGSRLVQEREHACDEEVLQLGNEPHVYAEGIINVCKLYKESPLTCVSGVTGSNLKKRVEAIMKRDIGHPLSIGRKLTLGLAIAGAIGVPVVGGATRTFSPSRQNQAAGVQLPSPGNDVKFEVASVRTNKSGGLTSNLGRPFKAGMYTGTNVALRNVIALAYEVPTAQVLGGPTWIGTASADLRFVGGDRFDIAARYPQGVGVDQVPEMLRSLLADRFKLIVRREIREAPLYALVVARDDGRLGPQLRKASIDCEAAEAAGAVIPTPKPGDRGVCEREIGGEILGRGQRLSTLARMLSRFAERPVIDRTGLTGAFDFALRFPELNTNPDNDRPRGEPVMGIFTALQEQLGLKLESTRGNLEFLVIDSVEKPSEN